jgi:hypothetical protein
MIRTLVGDATTVQCQTCWFLWIVSGRGPPPMHATPAADEIVSDTGLFQAGLFLSSLTGSSVDTFQSAFVSKILAATSVDYEVVGGVTNCSGAHCDVSLLWELFGDVLCLASAACQATTIIARNKIHDEDFSLLMVSSAY